jgi:hypothetical protein
MRKRSAISRSVTVLTSSALSPALLMLDPDVKNSLLKKKRATLQGSAFSQM